MKKYYLIGLLATLFATIRVDAQLIVKVNPAGLLLGPGTASVEYFPGTRISASVDGYVQPEKALGKISFYGAGVGVSGRFYATKLDRPRGLFLSPFIAEQWIRFKDIRSIDRKYRFTALGGQAGFQWVLKKIVTVELGAGVWTGLNVPVLEQAYGVKSYYGEGANWWINLGVGVLLWSE